MIIIGITGQSGSGKGFLSACFTRLGYIHADADAIYHDLLAKNADMKNELIGAFGKDIEKNGKIDRKVLGKKVFGKSNSRKLQNLNRITHKYVCREYVKLIVAAKESGAKGLIIDAPLLIEARLHKLCDTCICVACSDEVRIERIIKRDSISKESAMLRLRSQKPLEFYALRCEHIFINDENADAIKFASDIDRQLTEDTDE